MTTSAGSRGSGFGCAGGGRSGEAALAERGGAAADRGLGSGAGRFGRRGSAGERRQREPGLQMDPSLSGKLARSSLRRGQARVDGVVAEGARKPDVRSRSSHRTRSGGGKAGAGREGKRVEPEADPPRAAPHGAMEIRLPNGARVRIEAGVDGEALNRVLSTLSKL